ncbi:MAG: DUF4118 domain-containing protein [Oscillospiraceae bacterium]
MFLFDKVGYQKNAWLQLLVTIGTLCCATLISMLIGGWGFADTNIVVIYILSVIVISCITKGYFFGIFASIVSMLSFNFFFTAPIYTLKVYNQAYILTFGVMLLVAILTSTLTSKMVRSAKIANRHKKQFQTLYQITSSLAKASSISDVANISVGCLANLLDCSVSCITMMDGVYHSYTIKNRARNISSQQIQIEQLDQMRQDKFILEIGNTIYQYGEILLPKDCMERDESQSELLSSISTQIFIAMERERLAREKESAKNDVEREKFKSNLLRAISHDIRGPLANISGTSEVLLDRLQDPDDIEFVKGILYCSKWLTQMVENILSLTKVQEGSLHIVKEAEVVEEIIGAVLRYFAISFHEYRITVDIPQTILLVPMDGKLIVQVLINLIDNAIKHSNITDEIKVKVTTSKGQVWFSVSDQGSGIKPKDLPKLFELFFVSDDLPTDTKRGSGLGLPICKAIVKAHDGKIFAENNVTKGATFRFYLPLGGAESYGN